MWNHNAYYHSYLLRQIPKRVYRALDVGCGLGLFAWKLAERSEVVDALDVDGALKQIRKVADAVIPGFRLQRHLSWRYSLIWQKL